jgi:hypothetical protein
VHIRHCPECGSDYRPDIVNCADCGALLEDRDDELDDLAAATSTNDQAADDLSAAPEGFVPIFRADSVHDLRPLADCLLEMGIECRLREARSGSHVVGYRLLVPGDERVRAVEAATALLIDGSRVAPVAAEELPLDPAADGYSHCPACGTALSSGATACPECDLLLGDPAATCPECGQAVEPESQGRCGSCGCRLGSSD